MVKIKLKLKYNIKSNDFFEILTSENFYKYLLDRDKDLNSFKILYSTESSNFKNFKIILNFNSFIPEKVKKMFPDLLDDSVTETVLYNKSNKEGKVNCDTNSLKLLKSNMNYSYKLRDNNGYCEQFIIYDFNCNLPIIYKFIEKNAESKIKDKSLFMYNILSEFIDNVYNKKN